MTDQDCTDDAQRLRAICAGLAPASTRAHGAIHRQYLPKFTAFFRRFKRNPDELKDLLQTVWLKVWERACSFDGRGKASAWLWAVARYALYDTFDERAKFESLDAEWESATEPGSELETEIADPRSDPELLENRDLANRALDILAQLSPQYAVAVYLRVVEGQDYDEIDAALGKQGGNSRQFVSECHKRYDRIVLGLLDGKTPGQILEEFGPKRLRAGARA